MRKAIGVLLLSGRSIGGYNRSPLGGSIWGSIRYVGGLAFRYFCLSVGYAKCADSVELCGWISLD